MQQTKRTQNSIKIKTKQKQKSKQSKNKTETEQNKTQNSLAAHHKATMNMKWTKQQNKKTFGQTK